LRAIYEAATRQEGQMALERSDQKWDAKYPTVSLNWRIDPTLATVSYDYPPDGRRNTTNAIE
jgi:transposase-like protein